MLRKDVASDEMLAQISAIIEEQCVSRPAHLNDFLLEDLVASNYQAAGFGGRGAGHMQDGTFENFTELRRQNGFPARDAPGGLPYTKHLPLSVRQMLGPRKMELANLIMLAVQRRHGQDVPADLVGNLSQSFSRTPWTCSGTTMQTLTTSSEWWHFARQRYIVAPEYFQMMGWPVEDLNLAGLEDVAGDWRNLTGNMMCIPCIGLLIFATLACVPVHPETDFTNPPRESSSAASSSNAAYLPSSPRFAM